ncbi:MAG: hypothetical protein EOO46_09035 [Flavobacterium sp.]|nr:MAG: hypothetical protein EOO46_09035 [Flavobacterium sp.]
MKNFILAVFILIGINYNCFSQQIYSTTESREAIVYMNDGTTIEGILVNQTPFKANYVDIELKDGIKKIKKNKINRLVVGSDEFKNMNVYNEKGTKILKEKKLLKLEVVGKANLYSDSYLHSEAGRTNAYFYKRKVFYCHKADEEALTLLHYDFDQLKKNQEFKAVATQYFADNSSVVEKINKGQFTYKNIPTLVEEYNQ